MEILGLGNNPCFKILYHSPAEAANIISFVIYSHSVAGMTSTVTCTYPYLRSPRKFAAGKACMGWQILFWFLFCNHTIFNGFTCKMLPLNLTFIVAELGQLSVSCSPSAEASEDKCSCRRYYMPCCHLFLSRSKEEKSLFTVCYNSLQYQSGCNKFPSAHNPLH